MHSVRISAHFSRTYCAFLRISGAQIAGAEVVEEEEEEGIEVPKEVVEVLKNAQVKLQDCLDCVYEDRDPPNESDCLAADRTHTLAKLMNNNTVAQLEAIFDFEDMDELFGIAKTKKKDTNKKKAYYVAYLIICLKHNCGECGHAWLEANSERAPVTFCRILNAFRRIQSHLLHLHSLLCILSAFMCILSHLPRCRSEWHSDAGEG